MRWTPFAAALVVALAAASARAHGGGGFRGPPGPPPPGCSEPSDARFGPPPATTGRGPVTGRVCDAEGQPVRGAYVWCDGAPAAVTGADGRFRCAPLTYPAEIVVTDGRRAALRRIASPAPAPGAHLDLGDLVQPDGGEVTGSIEGDAPAGDDVQLRIVPERSRVPEWFAAIGRLTGWNGVRARCGRTFVFRGLPPDSYRVVAWRGDGEPVVVARGVRPGAAPVAVRFEDVPAPPALSGRPLDGSLVLTGAEDRWVAVIDVDRGICVFSRQGAERLEVVVPADRTLAVVSVDDDGLLPPVEGLRSGQEVRLPEAIPERTSVAGRVVRRDGTPVAHARLRACAAADVSGFWTRNATTDAAGAFRIDGVCGSVTLRATAPGLTSDEHPCTVSAGTDQAQVIVDEERLP